MKQLFNEDLELRFRNLTVKSITTKERYEINSYGFHVENHDNHKVTLPVTGPATVQKRSIT